jgi:hypothetical protein
LCYGRVLLLLRLCILGLLLWLILTLLIRLERMLLGLRLVR